MEEQRSKPAKKNEGQQPEKVIRHGAVAASIWRRMSPSGFAYFDFSLSRSWKSLSTARTGYSNNFFAQHQPELQKTVEEACAWIAANSTKEPTVSEESLAA